MLRMNLAERKTAGTGHHHDAELLRSPLHPLGSFDFVALEDLAAGAGTDITGDAQVTMQAETIVLCDGFTASPAAGTQGQVTITCPVGAGTGVVPAR